MCSVTAAETITRALSLKKAYLTLKLLLSAPWSEASSRICSWLSKFLPGEAESPCMSAARLQLPDLCHFARLACCVEALHPFQQQDTACRHITALHVQA